MRLYEQATQAARENGFVHNEGLAHEVAAHLTGGRWLAPAVPAVGFNTSLDGAGVIAPS